MFFRVHHLYWTTHRRIVSADSRLMFCQSRVEVVGLANVERPVGTSQDIHERHRTTMPSSDSIWNYGICLVALRLALARPSADRPLAQDYHSTDVGRPNWMVPFDSRASRLRRAARSLRTTIRLMSVARHERTYGSPKADRR